MGVVLYSSNVLPFFPYLASNFNTMIPYTQKESWVTGVLRRMRGTLWADRQTVRPLPGMFPPTERSCNARKHIPCTADVTKSTGYQTQWLIILQCMSTLTPHEQVAAVLRATGHIATATYLKSLRISTIPLKFTKGRKMFPQNCPFCRGMRAPTEYMVPWFHPSPHPKWSVSHFCRAHSCDQHTHRPWNTVTTDPS